jgi:hypothetical protein
LEAARRAVKVDAGELVVDPEEARPIEAHWKHRAQRYGEKIAGVTGSSSRSGTGRGKKDYVAGSRP